MQKTKIEWADYVFNPIKGLCPVGCWYCYARRIYKRFDMVSDLALDNYCFDYGWPRKPSRIFVCSTMEIFHPDIPNVWRDKIFDRIEDHPEHTFIILTKIPENIDRPMPPNVWLGVTITGEGQDTMRWLDLEKAKARVKFISFEPILAPIRGSFSHCPEIPAWTIWGSLTGHGKKKAEFDRRILFDGVDFFKKVGTKIFIKNNLRDVWGPNLIQEFPE